MMSSITREPSSVLDVVIVSIAIPVLYSLLGKLHQRGSSMKSSGAFEVILLPALFFSLLIARETRYPELEGEQPFGN